MEKLLILIILKKILYPTIGLDHSAVIVNFGAKDFLFDLSNLSVRRNNRQNVHTQIFKKKITYVFNVQQFHSILETNYQNII